jgi:hypothetical protein
VDDNESRIVQYSIQSNEKVFDEIVGGGVDDYIKIKEVS